MPWSPNRHFSVGCTAGRIRMVVMMEFTNTVDLVCEESTRTCPNCPEFPLYTTTKIAAFNQNVTVETAVQTMEKPMILVRK